MQHIALTPWTFHVEPLREQLAEHPELWNRHRLRTEHPQSPHREIDDIWVRYNAWKGYRGDGRQFNAPHESVWYPCIERIPAARELSLELYFLAQARILGGILITRVPPGKQVYRHEDHGWHARYYEKYAIQVASAPGQGFCFDDGALDARPGECYRFDNAHPHWVLNPTDRERITLIVCVRRH